MSCEEVVDTECNDTYLDAVVLVVFHNLEAHTLTMLLDPSTEQRALPRRSPGTPSAMYQPENITDSLSATKAT